MIIPYSQENEEYNIGDDIIIIKEIDTGFCIVSVGHKMKIIEKDNASEERYRKYKLIDSDDNIIENIYSDKFTHLYSFKESKELMNDRKAKNLLNRICHSHCSKRTIKSWDKWDDYIACDLKENEGDNDDCVPTISCLKYVDYELPTEITQYVRKLKIKKLL